MFNLGFLQDISILITDGVANFKKVDIAASESNTVEVLTVPCFDLRVEYSVAIGQEVIPLLKIRSRVSAKLSNWSAKVILDQNLQFPTKGDLHIWLVW